MNSPEPKSPFFRKEQFQTFQYIVFLFNTTTKTEVTKPGVITLEEVSEEGCVLKTPKASCAQGHMLLLYILNKDKLDQVSDLEHDGLREEALFSVTGKVAAVEKSGNDSQLISIQYYQFIQKEWETFMQSHQELQKRVDQLIHGIKGH